MKYILAFFILLMSNLAITQNTYKLSGGVEAPLLYAGAMSMGISIPINKKVEPLTKFQINELDPLSISKFDRVSTKTFGLGAQKLSDKFLYSSPVLPLTLLLDGNSSKEFGTISTMYFETMLVNYGITELTKVLIKRTRPFVYNKNADHNLKMKRNARKSFFSGHTSTVAASTFFTAKVLSDMNPGGNNNAYWITAAAIPALTAYLRVRGGKHFPTDVLIGYTVGALIGILVPELHK